jgi:hypothetical protein
MPEDPHECELNEARFRQLAESASTPNERESLLSLAETWKRLLAETQAEEALLDTLVSMELSGEPWNALPKALSLRDSCSSQNAMSKERRCRVAETRRPSDFWVSARLRPILPGISLGPTHAA